MKKIKKLVWLWWSKKDDEEPTHIDTFTVELDQANKVGTRTPNITIKTGQNEDGSTEKAYVTGQPLLSLNCDGNGYDVIEYNGNKIACEFRLNYSSAQLLRIALWEADRQKAKTLGTREVHGYFKGDLKDALKLPRFQSKKQLAKAYQEYADETYALQIKETPEQGLERPPAPIRPVGDVLLDMEPLLIELAESHQLQFGDILNLVRGYLEVHLPNAREVYTEDDSSPVMYYGPASGLKNG
jgi:hypothetical protein